MDKTIRRLSQKIFVGIFRQSFFHSFFVLSLLLNRPMSSAAHAAVVDAEYPGTAVERMLNVQQRVRSLSPAELNGDWSEVRRRLLWAGGLRDLPSAMPGRGYTGHSFNDFNHCDLTTMRDDVVGLDNNGQVEYVAVNNPLGTNIIFDFL